MRLKALREVDTQTVTSTQLTQGAFAWLTFGLAFPKKKEICSMKHLVAALYWPDMIDHLD